MFNLNFSNLSLRNKVIWITGLSTSIALVLACLTLAVNERVSYPKVMANNLSALAQVLGDNSTAALAFNDNKTAQSMLDTLKSNSHIMNAVLFDAKGQIFATYSTSPNPKVVMEQPEGYEVSGSSLRMFRNIDMNGSKQGSLFLETDLKEMNDRMGGYLLVTALVLVLSIGVSFLTSLKLQAQISDPLRNIIGSLSDSADQMTSSSNQISTASQQLAEGASESASSLEETSSSLEEMASMTRQNAENAKRARSLTEETQTAVQKGNQSVSLTLTAMKEMNESAEKVSKILKTIEEIAFQTNLLALNAAVEAARAGEQGRGFAVVADEVRSLAQRSSNAAKDTAALIEENARRASLGLKISDEAGKALGEIVEQTQKVSRLVQEIAGASEEQSKGIQEVNGAVTQLDTITQRNSANAEEMSSSSEEMSAQSKVLKEMIGGLVTVLEGGKKKRGDKTSEIKDSQEQPIPIIPMERKNFMKRPVVTFKRAMAGGAPGKIIPLSEEDMRNF